MTQKNLSSVFNPRTSERFPAQIHICGSNCTHNLKNMAGFGRTGCPVGEEEGEQDED